MKMTPLNIALLVAAGFVGLFLGLRYPLVGLLLLIPAIIFVALVFLRNKSGAMATPEETAAAMTLTAPAGKARLYIRRKGFIGGQQGMNITIGGTLNSQIRTNYFLMAELEPGTHSVKAKMSSGTESAARTYEVTLAAGECVLLDMKLNVGMIQGAPDFTEVRDMVEANQLLQGCRLVLWKTDAA